MGMEAKRDEVARLNEITGKIIAGAYAVGNTLGPGFLEKVYENALVHELRKAGLHAEQQVPIDVWYDGVVVGNYVADVLVERSVVVEVKAVKAFEDVHFAQCLNYLKATELPICLLINFGAPKVQIKRLVGTSFKTLSDA
jgi:GxxExxY protein